MIELGTLKRLVARTVWVNEARDSTPWLARNLPMLAEVIGIDLERLTKESPVGAFSLDLLAKDLGRNRLVVRENQLESTNHDHLGRLLTYAAGHDAGVMVHRTNLARRGPSACLSRSNKVMPFAAQSKCDNVTL